MADARVLVVGVDTIEVGVSPQNSVTVLFPVPKELAAAEGLYLGIDLSPAQAREIATLMLRKADEAQAGLSQH